MTTSLLTIHGGALLVVLGLFLSVARSGSGATAYPSIPERLRLRLLVAGGLLVGPVGVSGVLLARAVPDGVAGLLGTRHGRLLLVQAALLVAALGMLAPLVRSASRLPPRGVRWALATAIALCLGMTLLAAGLAALPSSAAETVVWPFAFRLAPGVMWRFPSVRDRVFVGAEILVGGLLAFLMAYRVKGWRPLLLAAGVACSVIGLYQALSAMAIDAYPTTYARPAVEPTPESVGRGRDLFLTHCAPCHGPSGRGDGPAAAGLLQQPADLTAAHTADHTPGDIFWWVSHGLGLAMPAFADRLSTQERWHVVNFVLTLSGGSRRSSGSVSGTGR
jgi:mono/diheme cytochrome c family protein